MMDIVKRKKDYSLSILIFVILASLAVMVFGPRFLRSEENGDETVIEEKSGRPCEVREHYTVYLGVGEVYVLDDIGYKSEDETIASVKTNRVTGNAVGKTVLKKDCNTYEVEVTDLITAPYFSPNKEQIPCGRYTEEENEYLDTILATKIAERGFATRAGAVQAARFLTLQFPYHMSYFNENGRLPVCDGEGRYYHRGLFLHQYKVEKENITNQVMGAKPWGCYIFAIPLGAEQRNSLDCSGFITWCIYNGGFDPGDIGAGPAPGSFDLTDLGENHAITEESLDEVKVGDLFSENGHIAMLIGIKDGQYYIAESNSGIDIRTKGWTKEDLIRSAFTAWVDMDEFYGYKDGKLNQYWE